MISRLTRRSLIAAFPAGALAVYGAAAVDEVIPGRSKAVEKTFGIRVSCITGDPGEVRYAEALADGMKITVYLDGVECHGCWTADETEGYIVRPRKTAKGNIMVNRATGDILEETVYGNVKVVIV